MATKRQVVAQLSTEQIQLLTEAATAGATTKNFNPADLRKVKRGVKILRTVKAAQ